MVFRQCRRQERQAGRTRVLLENRTVNRSKESLHINGNLVALSAMAVANCRARRAGTTKRPDGLMGFSQLTSQRLGNRAWHTRRQINFVESIAVTFEESDG